MILTNIEHICVLYRIKKFTINDNLTIDVNGDVDLSAKKLPELPLMFRKVKGTFDCQYNKLTTLNGCPTYIGDGFSCNNNKLTSFAYCPTHIGGKFECGNNKFNTRINITTFTINGNLYSDNLWKF